MASSMTFQFLDVGMGDGTLVQIRPEGQAYDTLVLVDFGEEKSQYKVGWKDALAYLRTTIAENTQNRGKKDHPYVDYLFITHSDKDHHNKIAELWTANFPGYGTELRFGTVRYSGRRSDYPSTLMDGLDARAASVSDMESNWGSPVATGVVTPYLTFGTSGDRINVYVLSVNYPNKTAPPNPKSIVLLFELAGAKVILQGDAEEPTETAIRTRYATVPDFLRAFGLKLGHHGSDNATSTAWADAVRPRAVFASADFVWRHPYCNAICRARAPNNLLQTAYNVWYCCGNGPEYYNNTLNRAVCMNLWYWCKTDNESLIEYPDKTPIVGKQGWTWGVQWSLALASGGLWDLRQTYSVLPADPSKIPGGWDCSRSGAATADHAPHWLDADGMMLVATSSADAPAVPSAVPSAD